MTNERSTTAPSPRHATSVKLLPQTFCLKSSRANVLICIHIANSYRRHFTNCPSNHWTSV